MPLSLTAPFTATHVSVHADNDMIRLASRQATLSMMCAEPKQAASKQAVSKQALVDVISARAGVSKKTVSNVLGSALDVIVESVVNGDKVTLVGFGAFDSRRRPARKGRNPRNGQEMSIEAATVPTFTFGKTFKERVKAAGNSGQASD